ncbi:hypothetical protein C492_04810 [Natronococcus jeotgali DSM 18795]|uniref:Uncharacterized protein n=1 Tax=Natronococcus jeotgali DSM 18795 TaxID=1227498 RepID=L9XSN9_9EURY|nr:hypothetical protein C492_04810 [Natronococcus jeotgali DSM 18795]
MKRVRGRERGRQLPGPRAGVRLDALDFSSRTAEEAFDCGIRGRRGVSRRGAEPDYRRDKRPASALSLRNS